MSGRQTALVDPLVGACLSQMIWPRLWLVREWLLMLDEWEFRSVPSALEADLSKLAPCFASTKCVEDAFNILRGFARHSPNSKNGKDVTLVADAHKPDS